MNQNPHLILCIDDEKIGLHVRQKVLQRAGYAVLTAEDGPRGLEVFSQHPVDAVILDYSMPGMDGGQLAARMRQTKPEIPILLLSAYMDLPPEVTSIVDCFITKGEGAPFLLNKLETLLAIPANR